MTTEQTKNSKVWGSIDELIERGKEMTRAAAREVPSFERLKLRATRKGLELEHVESGMYLLWPAGAGPNSPQPTSSSAEGREADAVFSGTPAEVTVFLEERPDV